MYGVASVSQQQTKQKQHCYTTTNETVATLLHNNKRNSCNTFVVVHNNKLKQKLLCTQQQTFQKQRCYTTTNETVATPYTFVVETVLQLFVCTTPYTTTNETEAMVLHNNKRNRSNTIHNNKRNVCCNTVHNNKRNRSNTIHNNKRNSI